jgi:RNA polymerase sigma factor (sigma-70 family)
MDQLLHTYLHAPNDVDAQDRLDELLSLHAAPVVRRTLRQRLGFSINRKGTNPHNPDAQDLYQEAMIRIVQALNDLRRSSRTEGIEDFRKYVAKVTGNVCRDYLRARSPARRRLKDNIRLVLTRHPDFALWQAKGDYVCGFSIWRENSLSPLRTVEGLTGAERIEDFRSSTYASENPSHLPLPKILSDLFKWTGKPLELDTVVTFIAALMNVRDQSHEVFDEQSEAYFEVPAARETVNAQSRVEEKELLQQLWDVVKNLPAPQRDAYCFLFHDERGWDLFSLLIESEIVSFGQLAKVLNRSPQEITRLRSRMPMDGPTAAAELNVTRPQVNKWRFLAIQRVRKAVGYFREEK